ncbi:MAG: 4-phosphoerythronate dehydrogenase [Alistipes sp.]|nr:4-phosphoerythronate dehydrogenase [Alistipes sp.]
MKIIVDSAIPFLRGVLEPYAEVQYVAGSAITAKECRDADALIVRTRTKCNAELLQGSSVQMIATATIGSDHIDHAYCRNHSIRTATAAGCNARGVLQWVSAVLAHLSQRDGFSPEERLLGIVGVGHVGSLVEEYARRWGFRTILCDEPRRVNEGFPSHSIEEVFEQADIVTMHVPLDATTYHLVDRAMIARLHSGAVLLNSSRGEVVAADALHSRSDIEFALDVWEGEPQLDRELLRRAVLCTPHIAGYSLQGKAMASAMAVRQIADHFSLPLSDWYPSGVAKSKPCDIGWEEMKSTIGDHFDIVAESRQLRSNPDSFEELRNNYAYRVEYF